MPKRTATEAGLPVGRRQPPPDQPYHQAIASLRGFLLTQQPSDEQLHDLTGVEASAIAPLIVQVHRRCDPSALPCTEWNTATISDDIWTLISNRYSFPSSGPIYPRKSYEDSRPQVSPDIVGKVSIGKQGAVEDRYVGDPVYLSF